MKEPYFGAPLSLLFCSISKNDKMENSSILIDMFWSFTSR